jgi:hypothetical protein
MLVWLGLAIAALWYAQSRAWVAGTHWHAVVAVTACWLAFPFIRAYVKLYKATRAHRELKDTTAKGA